MGEDFKEKIVDEEIRTQKNKSENELERTHRKIITQLIEFFSEKTKDYNYKIQREKTTEENEEGKTELREKRFAVPDGLKENAEFTLTMQEIQNLVRQIDTGIASIIEKAKKK